MEDVALKTENPSIKFKHKKLKEDNATNKTKIELKVTNKNLKIETSKAKQNGETELKKLQQKVEITLEEKKEKGMELKDLNNTHDLKSDKFQQVQK